MKVERIVFFYGNIHNFFFLLFDLNPNITRFDCSCFDGEYVTGDIDATYLDNLEASRSKPVKPAKDDEE